MRINDAAGPFAVRSNITKVTDFYLVLVIEAARTWVSVSSVVPDQME